MIVFGGCSSKTDKNSTNTVKNNKQETTASFKGQKLNLYVAAGLKKPMDEVINIFEKETGAKVVPSYGASGGLYTQIKEGQPCDLYFSADWLYVDKLKADGKLAEGQKFLQDNLVLAVSQTGKNKVKSVTDLIKPGVVVGVCDLQAPVGTYSEKAFKTMNIWDKLVSSGNIKARPATVNQLAVMIGKNELDAGLIYSSVAKANNLEYVEEIPQKYTGEIIFGSAIIKGGNEKLAKEFMKIANNNIDKFEKYGWKAVKE
ncbi:molybdate ABC transporter substrate-binding protein [Aceticella autotrophica]|uniref:Molybdate ABC transporter substrate-binding protein n=2 Tax=Aceticella autotrophica TaxID=2755338 RepID=A0A975GBA2_9THEO|nr:molybdate ABC transporter substrate-binding protein [Aceticella autotrophica]